MKDLLSMNNRLISLFAGISLAIVLSLTLFSGMAFAHKPVIEEEDIQCYEGAVVISDPDVSYALYGFLDSPDDTDCCYFDVVAPFNLSTQLNVPEKAIYSTFTPSIAIVGPGFNSSPELPFSLPPGNGALIIGSPEAREIFYEPIGGVSYYQGYDNRTLLNVSGRYYVVVYDPQRRRGDYVLTIGEKEDFPLPELPGILWSTIRIRFGVWDHSAIVSTAQYGIPNDLCKTASKHACILFSRQIFKYITINIFKFSGQTTVFRRSVYSLQGV